MSQYVRYPASGSGSGIAKYSSQAGLPGIANDGDAAVTLDTDTVWIFNAGSSTWLKVGSPGAALSIGTVDSQTASSNGAVITSNALVMQSASASNPGLVNNTSQTLSGSKTFTSVLNANAGIDRSTSGTLTIGATNSTTINIGNSGATVNIQGTTIYENTPQLLTSDPLITVNHGGGAASGQNAGIQVEEASSITGYAETSSDRNSWILKAPNTAGIATITPGAGGITLNQSSHDPVTINAVGSTPNANAISLAGQSLTLQPADGSNPGVITAGSQTIGGAKTFSSTISASNLSGTNSGDITLTAVGSSPGANGASLSGQALTLQPADGSNPGLVTAAAQTLGGDKTFTGAILASADNTKDIGSTTNRFHTGNFGNRVAVGVYPFVGGSKGLGLDANLISFSNTSGNHYSLSTSGTGFQIQSIGSAVNLLDLSGTAATFKNESSGNIFFSADGNGAKVYGATSGNLTFQAAASTTSYTLSFPSAVAGTAGSVLTSSTGGAISYTATLPAANGGTAQSTWTTGDLLYASATNTLSKLGIGSSAQVLTVSSGLPAWQAVGNISVVSKTTTYGASASDGLILCSSSAFTVTLPTAVGISGTVMRVKKTDSTVANIITIATTLSQTIDGASSTTLNTQNEEITVISDGANWQVQERYVPSIWTSFTPTGSWSTNTSYSGYWKREGSNLRVICTVSLSGANTQGALTVNIPNSATWAMDTNPLITTANTRLGMLLFQVHGGGASDNGFVGYNSSTSVTTSVYQVNGTKIDNVAVNSSSNVPVTFASGDAFWMEYVVPISGWNG